MQDLQVRQERKLGHAGHSERDGQDGKMANPEQARLASLKPQISKQTLHAFVTIYGEWLAHIIY